MLAFYLKKKLYCKKNKEIENEEEESESLRKTKHKQKKSSYYKFTTRSYISLISACTSCPHHHPHSTKHTHERGMMKKKQRKRRKKMLVLICVSVYIYSCIERESEGAEKRRKKGKEEIARKKM